VCKKAAIQLLDSGFFTHIFIPNLTNVLLYLSGSQFRIPPFLHTSLDDCYNQTLALLQRDQKLGSASDYANSVGAMRLLTMIGVCSIGSAASAADDGLNAFLDTMGDDAYIADLTADTADDIISTAGDTAKTIFGYDYLPQSEYATYLSDDLKITGGKVEGKIPVDDYVAIRKASVTNSDSNMMTLGKYDGGGETSYIARSNGSSYFDLGSENWLEIEKMYGLDDTDMFELFNKPALDDSISANKTIRFSHDPVDYPNSTLENEWNYIKGRLNLTNNNLVPRGGYWYVE